MIPEGQTSTDFDVLMGYHIFLGRDPENSHVIREKAGSSLKDLVHEFSSSEEFRNRLLTVSSKGTVGDQAPIELTGEHLDWIGLGLSLSSDQLAELKSVRTWQSLYALLFPAESTLSAAEPAARAALTPMAETPVEIIHRLERLLSNMGDELAALRVLLKPDSPQL